MASKDAALTWIVLHLSETDREWVKTSCTHLLILYKRKIISGEELTTQEAISSHR